MRSIIIETIMDFVNGVIGVPTTNRRGAAGKIFYKKLLSLVLPITFQQFMLALVSASDALMLGGLEQDALSAVSLASQIAFIQNLFLAAMTIGLSIFAAQYWGKKDITAIEKYFAFVLKITFCVSLVFTILSFCIPQYLMRVFTPEPALIEKGVFYLRTVSFSYLLTGISQIYLCILKNSGKAIQSSVISCVSVIVNILLNAVFIFGLLGVRKLGIAGAALATVTARLAEVLWCIFVNLKARQVRLRWAYLKRIDNKLRVAFWKYTRPVLGNEIVWGSGFTMFSVIMGHLGSDAVAANSIANIVKNLIACFCIGLGSGGGIMVGNELGAGKLDTARAYGKKLCKLSVVFGMLSGAFLTVLIPFILDITNLSQQAGHYLKWMLVMCSYYMIGRSVNGVTIAGIFCAGGDSKFGLRCDFIIMWCITVPLGLLTAFVLKLPVLAVYFIITLDETLKLPGVYKNYKKYKWVKDLTIKEEL